MSFYLPISLIIKGAGWTTRLNTEYRDRAGAMMKVMIVPIFLVRREAVHVRPGFQTGHERDDISYMAGDRTLEDHLTGKKVR